MLNNILSSGFDFEDNGYDLRTKYILFNSMLGTVSIVLLLLAIFRILISDYEQAMVDFGVAVISLIYMLSLRKFKKGHYKTASYIMIFIFASIIMYSYHISGGELKINAWFTVLVIPIFFIFGFHVAMFMSLLFMIAIATLNFNVEHKNIINTLYGYVPLFMAVMFLNIYELRFRQFNELLTDTNNNLEKIVQEKTFERTEVLENQKNELEHQAHHDHLTGLPNRLKFQKVIQNVIETIKQNHNNIAILFIDLDHFKNINDSFGHDTGDQVIRIIASRIQQCIRKNDCLARFGGDEFVILVDEFSGKKDLESIARNIISCISAPILIEKTTMFVSCSIGISFYPDDTVSHQDFIKYADTAMYKAKEKGRNTYQFYSSDMTKVAFERVLMETSMRFALEKEEFVVYYQPQVDAKTDKVIGMEALVRWNHEKMGLISPATFIPLAEETGLIIALDQWVMKTGMKQMVEWHSMGYNPGSLSLNLSVKQLQQKEFISIVKNMLYDTGCKAEWIELEITESHIMHNMLEAIETLNSIKDLGINIAIDDFGTGYSSLSYLKKLPADKLKIDRSFIIDIPDNKEDAAITNAIIAIAKSLDLAVIAEGVETRRQKDYLLKCGCNYIQGYFYHKPMPAEKMEIVLKEA